MIDLSSLASALGDRYRIERELGRGGMATVYLAEDLKHGRMVAVKVLAPELSGAIGPDRFLREIATTAGLRHPHVLPLYDSGQSSQPVSFLYYVMPYVDGESLRDRLTREGQLPIDDALRIAGEIADALGYAHSRGIVHRDVKPENVLLEGGHAVVADFGIAKAVSAAGDESLTLTGMAIGTPQYMSPEQATGDKHVDERSDVYALGCVLYEMLAGEPPFTGPTAHAILARALTESPRSLDRVRTGIPPALLTVVSRALARAPADRYRTAADLAAALAAATGPGAASRAAGGLRAIHPRRLRVALPIGAAILVLFVAGGQLIRSRTGAADVARSIAVLPFENASPDTADAFLGDGLSDELHTALAEVPRLRVAARSSALALRDSQLDVREIGRRLGVEAVLEGSVRRSGGLLHVTVRLADARTGFQLYSQRFDRAATDVFTVQEDIARAVVERLRVRMLTSPDGHLVRSRTEDPIAHELLLRARHVARVSSPETLREALALANAAIARDSGYSAAWAALARLYEGGAIFGDFPPEALRLARLAADRAVALDSLSSEAHSTLGNVLFRHDWDWERAERHLRRAIELNPSLAVARSNYSRYLRSMGRFDAARSELVTAFLLDPLGSERRTLLGRISYFARDHERAVRETVADTVPSRVRSHWLAQAYLEAGNIAAAESLLAADDEHKFIAVVYARTGRNELARQILRDSFERPYLRAELLAALGDADAAINELKEAEARRDPLMVDLKVNPLLDPLREHPRFRAMMARMDFPR